MNRFALNNTLLFYLRPELCYRIDNIIEVQQQQPITPAPLTDQTEEEHGKTYEWKYEEGISYRTFMFCRVPVDGRPSSVRPLASPFNC